MIIIDACHCQYHIDQGPNNTFCISVGSRKKSIISVDIFACYSAVKSISLFDKTMEPIYRIKVIETGILSATVIAVFDSTVCNSGKCVITPKTITQSKCPICYMSFKYADKLFCTGFRPVNSDS